MFLQMDITADNISLHDDSHVSTLGRVPSNLTNTAVTALCLIGNLRHNEELRQAISDGLQLLLLESADGKEHIEHDDVGFVIPEFESVPECPDPVYSDLFQLKRRIYGPTIILECVSTGQPLPAPTSSNAVHRQPRPVYCHSMKKMAVYFTHRFAKNANRHRLQRLASLVHWMGGSVRKDLTLNVTHVVSPVAAGKDYRLAVGWGKPIMQEQWILALWERRHTLHSFITPECFNKLKVLPFQGLKLCLVGFSDHEMLMDMHKQCVAHGGCVVDDVSECDHLVVDIHNTPEFQPPANLAPGCFVVTEEWFWLCIQLNLCANEDMYPVQQSGFCTVVSLPVPSFGAPSVRSMKRKSSATRTKSSEVSLGAVSLDASSELSFSHDPHLFSTDDPEAQLRSPAALSKRHPVAREMLEQEQFYVQILTVLVKEFKEPLESMSKLDDALMTDIDVRHIFGHVPQILEVHAEICRDMTNQIMHWQEDRLIGAIWHSRATKLQAVYPPFVNFFEKSKDMLHALDRANPRFHAFLQRVRAACRTQHGKLELDDMMIRIVRRLGSVVMLLQRLLDNTPKANPDFEHLERALSELRRVNLFLDNAKQKTEEQVLMFNTVQKIENCPVYLLSATRQLVSQIEALDLSNQFGTKKGQHVTLFLYNDCLQVTKRRRKANHKFPFKHMQTFYLSSIRRLLDVVTDEFGEEVAGIHFCILARAGEETEERKCWFAAACMPVDRDAASSNKENTGPDSGCGAMSSFRERFLDASLKENLPAVKGRFLKATCRAVAAYVNKEQREQELLSRVKWEDFVSGDSGGLDVHMAQLNDTISSRVGTLSRKFSFRGTPNSLKRAVSNLSLRMGGTLSRMSLSRSNLRLQDTSELSDSDKAIVPKRVSRLAPSASFVVKGGPPFGFPGTPV